MHLIFTYRQCFKNGQSKRKRQRPIRIFKTAETLDLRRIIRRPYWSTDVNNVKLLSSLKMIVCYL